MPGWAGRTTEERLEGKTVGIRMLTVVVTFHMSLSNPVP